MTLDEFEKYLKTCVKSYGELRDKSVEMVSLVSRFDFTHSINNIADGYKKSAEIYDFIAASYQDALEKFKKTKD